MVERVRVVEVGPRDGLQNEAQVIATPIKRELIERLSRCGLPVIEATSFVSPRWVPQLADAAELLANLDREPGVAYPVLVPNLVGFERARAAGVSEVAVFTAASDEFNRRNINCDTAESLARLEPVVAAGLDNGMKVRAYLSCALGCPYQGVVDASTVARIAEQLITRGCHEVSLGDTTGVGTPGRARSLLKDCATADGIERLAVHFHDTYGQALANIYACLEEGVRTVDASVAGLGGCPYAHGASGNAATEDLVYMLQGLGFETGIDLPALVATGRWISAELGRPPASRLGRMQ